MNAGGHRLPRRCRLFYPGGKPAGMRHVASLACFLACAGGNIAQAGASMRVPGAEVAAPAPSAPLEDYDALILRARDGEYDPALRMLRVRTRMHPEDLRAAYDLVRVALWARRPGEALAAWKSIAPVPEHPPADVVNDAATAARDARQWEDALALYRLGRRTYPQDTRFTVGEVKVLADAGNLDAAQALGRIRVAQAPDDPDLQLALAYAMEREALHTAVLQRASRAHDLAPRKDYVTREYIDALQRAGLAEPALRMADSRPDLVDAAQRRRLQLDYAASLTRLAELPTRREQNRHQLADQAIALYDRWISEWEAQGGAAADDALRARADRLHALHARSRMAEVVQGYAALRERAPAVPGHVLQDVASAYLYLRQPEDASVLYRASLENGSAAPADRSGSQSGLYYALLEDERHEQAAFTLAQARKEQPVWRMVKGKPERLPNDLNLYLAQTAIQGDFYSGHTRRSARDMRALVMRAPNNTILRTALAEIQRGRLRPRAAERELKMAETLASRDDAVVAGQAYTALDLQEWGQARLLLDDAEGRSPESLTTQQLARRWAVHQKAELRIGADRGLANDSPIAGEGDLRVDAVLYSPPMGDNWRAFGGGGYGQGKFEEGNAHYRWLLAGVEWRGRDLTAEGEISTHSYGEGAKPGLRLSADHDLDDHWRIGASAALRTTETPLRALRAGIYANRFQVRARWRADDQHEWTLALTPSHFSDGNKRIEALVTGRRRIQTSPRLKTDLGMELSASRNTRRDTLYFNPRADLMALPTLRFTHLLYRRYENTLEQQLTLGAGLYAQRGHGAGAIGLIGYGLRHRANDVLDVGITMTGTSRPYDGRREREFRVMLDLNLRF